MTIRSKAIYAICTISIFFYGCASIEQDYRNAKSRDTISSWENFLYNYKKSEREGSEYTEDAKRRLAELKAEAKEKRQKKFNQQKIDDEINWENARNINTILSYSEYLVRYTKGNFKDLEAAQKYQEQYNQGFFILQAQELLSAKVDSLIQTQLNLNQINLEPGSDFPFEEFSVDDVIEAIGKSYQTGSLAKTKNGKTHNFQARRMAKHYGSSKDGRLILVRKPDQVIVGSLLEVLGQGGVVNSKIRIGDEGYAIIKAGGRTRVFELSKVDMSVFE